jgi:hypothetical protein
VVTKHITNDLSGLLWDILSTIHNESRGSIKNFKQGHPVKMGCWPCEPLKSTLDPDCSRTPERERNSRSRGNTVKEEAQAERVQEGFQALSWDNGPQIHVH